MNIRLLLPLGISVFVLWSIELLFRGTSVFWLTAFCSFVLVLLLERRPLSLGLGLFASLFAGMIALSFEYTIQATYTDIDYLQSKILLCSVPMIGVGLLVWKDRGSKWLSF